MQELSEQLLDMHGQREHMAVLKKEKQLELIDSFGDKEISPLLEEVHNAYSAFKESERALKESDRDPSEIKRELDFLRFEADEIEKAGLKEGESAAFGGEEEDPFDVVIGIHRVDDLSDLDVDPAINFDEGGDVLLLGGVDFVGLELSHRFAAANRSGAEVIEFCDDRAAM